MPPVPTTLERLGWGPFFADSFDAIVADAKDAGDLEPARVSIEHNYLFRVQTATCDEAGVLASVAGSIKHAALTRMALPGVGDWVALRVNDTGPATIRAVLPRRTYFSRKAAGNTTAEQVVAANIDTIFLVSGLDDDFNENRIQRYLVAAADSGAQPVVVLNKADLSPGLGQAIDVVRRLAGDVPIHGVSCVDQQGLEALASYLRIGQTVALLGSSGVGKSTIINRLLGHERQRTRSTRDSDGHGRHTTVHRELLVHPDGGVIIDTPGMRELRLWDRNQAVEIAFDDIERYAKDCRFRDCLHRTEPECAVRRAVEDGAIGPDRLTRYDQLRQEREQLTERRDQLTELVERQAEVKQVPRPSRRVFKR